MNSNQHLAVIDIGTNTVHIIIALVPSTNARGMQKVFQKRVYTYLGENGLGHIDPETYARLEDALVEFEKAINLHPVDKIKVIATEAIRKADNASAILNNIEARFGWNVEVINAQMEAKFLYEAVKNSFPISIGRHVLVDIGGGSVEFVITHEGQVGSVHSLPIGIAHLFNRFHHNDPITDEDIKNVGQHIKDQIEAVQKELSTHDHILIGMAGTFEIFYQNLSKEELNPNYRIIDLEGVEEFCHKVIQMDLKGRENHPFVPKVRAKYVVVALILIQEILRVLKPSSFVVSKYSIKEGVVFSMV